MRILRPYLQEAHKQESPYHGNCNLMRAIKEKYDYEEVVFPPEMDEEEKAEIIRQYDVLLTCWQSPHVPNSLAENPGNLKYICNITGEMRRWIDPELVASPKLVVTNWGDAPAYGVAEGAFALLMATLKEIPVFVRSARENGFGIPEGIRLGSLYGTKIGIFGMGVIGRKFVEFLRPFEPRIYAYDPFVTQMPEGVTRMDTLEELFDVAQIMVIHAGLTEQTRGIVTGDLLSRLPDGGIIINTARGAIIEREALEKEILSGRLRGGLDVLAPKDMPEVDSPLRTSENCVLSAHHISGTYWGVDPEMLTFTDRNCLDNLARFEAGEPLKFVMTPERYALST